jgi:hypothetical protein
MDKPIAMPVKEYLLRILSVRNNIPLKTVEAVINHQLDGVVEATKKNASVEISGFGKILFNHRKAIHHYNKQLSKMELADKIMADPNGTEAKKKKWAVIKENCLKIAEDIKPKINEYIRTDMGGVAQFNISPKSPEGEDREHLPSEDGSVQGV